MSFKEIYDSQNWEEAKELIYNKTSYDVEKALSANRRTLEDFKALISPQLLLI